MEVLPLIGIKKILDENYEEIKIEKNCESFSLFLQEYDRALKILLHLHVWGKNLLITLILIDALLAFY